MVGAIGLFYRGTSRVTLTVAGWPLIPAAAMVVAGIWGAIRVLVA